MSATSIVTNSDPVIDANLDVEREAFLETARAELEKAGLTSCLSLMKDYKTRLRNRNVAQLFNASTFPQFEIGPGLLTLLGAPPAAGKTAFAMQLVFEILAGNPDLNVVVANAETSFEGLLRRQIVAITGIRSRKVRFGELSNAELTRIDEALDSLEPSLTRMSWMVDCNAATIDKLSRLKPGLLIVDYLQKFTTGDEREGIKRLLDSLRSLALDGWAILAISATARTQAAKSSGGHDSSKLTQSSYRGSSELEYNADSAYLLVDNGDVEGERFQKNILLKHVKNRHDSTTDHNLVFDMPRCRFVVAQTEVFSSPFDGDFEQ